MSPFDHAHGQAVPLFGVTVTAPGGVVFIALLKSTTTFGPVRRTPNAPLRGFVTVMIGFGHVVWKENEIGGCRDCPAAFCAGTVTVYDGDGGKRLLGGVA